MAKVNFTKTNLDKLHLPQSGWVYYQDEKTPGLSIGVGNAGIKTFCLYKRINGRPERVKIGRYPETSIEQARRRAMDLQGQIAQGKNPAEAKRDKLSELNLQDLFDLYIKRYAKPHGLRTIYDMEQLFNCYLGKLTAERKKHGRERTKPAGSVDWSGKKISLITQRDVCKLHHDIGTLSGKIVANRVVDLLRAVFNRCKKLKLIDIQNPAEGIEAFKETKRDRFLQMDEIPKFFNALLCETEQNRDFFMLSLMTGARKSNVLSMRWKDLDLAQELWKVPEEISKNGQPMLIPLTKTALEVLKRRLESSDSDFIFPGAGKFGHMTSPKRAWQRVVSRAKIDNIRPHDLRRSLGSWMVNTGASLAIIGGALGHKDTKSTEIYARLAINPVKDAMEKAQSAMLEFPLNA